MIPYATVFALMAPQKAVILQEGVRQAQTVAGATKPTTEQIRITTAGYAKQIAAQWILPGLNELLVNAVTTYTAQMGPRPATPADDPNLIAWQDAFDEHIMDNMGADMVRDASQDFIGEYVTDAAIDEPDTLNRTAQILADRLVEAAVKGRTPGQLLAEIEIVKEDIEPYAAAETPTQAAETVAASAPVITEPHARSHVERLVGAYAIKLGVANFDMAAFTELMKLAFDDEEFLSLGALQQVGGTRQDWPFFVAYMKASPSHLEDTVNAAFMAAMTGNVVEAPKDIPKPKKQTAAEKKAAAKLLKEATVVAPPPVSAPAPAVAHVAAGAATPAAAQAGDDYSAVIKMLHEHRLASEEGLGELIGVSRGTVNNIVKKGRACPLTPVQTEKLRKAIIARIEGLNTALQLL